jgi:hypothetical protein
MYLLLQSFYQLIFLVHHLVGSRLKDTQGFGMQCASYILCAHYVSAYVLSIIHGGSPRSMINWGKK